MFDLDFDDLLEIGKDLVDQATDAASNLIDKTVDVIKEEAPHIVHKTGEIIEDVVKKIK